MNEEIEIIPGSFKHEVEIKEGSTTIVERMEWSMEINWDVPVHYQGEGSPGRFRKGKKALKRIHDNPSLHIRGKVETLALRYIKFSNNRLDAMLEYWEKKIKKINEKGTWESSSVHQ